MKNIRLGDVLIEFGYHARPAEHRPCLPERAPRPARRPALQGAWLRRQASRSSEALAQRLQLTMIDIEHTNVDVTAVEGPQELAQKYDMLPIAQVRAR